MAILFAGGEDTSFSLIGGNAIASTSASTFRAAFARSSVSVLGGSVADPPASRIATPPFSAASTLWLHAWQFVIAGGSNNQQGLILRSPDGVSRLLLRAAGTAGAVKLSSRNAAGTIVDLVTSPAGAIPASALFQFDLFVNYAVAGGVTLYVNSAPILTYSGDVTTDGATQVNQAELASLANESWWSEVIIADRDTRAMALWTLVPQAPGNTQSWLPNTVGNINEAIINDANSIGATSTNQLSEWTVPAAAPGGTWNVSEVVQNARVQAGVGAKHIDWVARTGGADYLAGAPAAPPGTFTNFSHAWPINPATGAAWQLGDITAAGFNLGIISQT